MSSKRLIAIGDVHGCSEELRRLLGELPLDDDPTIIFLGDYIDRGPDSKGVIEMIMALREKHDVVTLKGNHEAMLFEFLEDPTSAKAGMFIYNGGGATLASYGVEGGKFQVPPDHLKFFEELRLFYESDEYFFVHAGLPDIPLEDIDLMRYEQHLLWMREPFLGSEYKWSKTIVHGHTPVVHVDIRPNRINVDTGCVLGNTLSAIDLTEGVVYEVQRQRNLDPPHLSDDTRRRAVRFEGSIPVFVETNAGVLEFETLDYSEMGMFCRDISNGITDALEKGDIFDGRIGHPDDPPVSFQGQVVRKRIQTDGVYYAFRVLNTPLPQGSGLP